MILTEELCSLGWSVGFQVRLLLTVHLCIDVPCKDERLGRDQYDQLDPNVDWRLLDLLGRSVIKYIEYKNYSGKFIQRLK